MKKNLLYAFIFALIASDVQHLIAMEEEPMLQKEAPKIRVGKEKIEEVWFTRDQVGTIHEGCSIVQAACRALYNLKNPSKNLSRLDSGLSQLNESTLPKILQLKGRFADQIRVRDAFLKTQVKHIQGSSYPDMVVIDMTEYDDVLIKEVVNSEAARAGFGELARHNCKQDGKREYIASPEYRCLLSKSFYQGLGIGALIPTVLGVTAWGVWKYFRKGE